MASSSPPQLSHSSLQCQQCSTRSGKLTSKFIWMLNYEWSQIPWEFDYFLFISAIFTTWESTSNSKDVFLLLKIKCHFQISENITDSGNTNSALLLVTVASNTHPIHLTTRTLRDVFFSSFCFPSTQLLKWQKEASWTLPAFLWSMKLMPSHGLRKTVVKTHSAASEHLSNMELQVGLGEISINSYQLSTDILSISWEKQVQSQARPWLTQPWLLVEGLTGVQQQGKQFF